MIEPMRLESSEDRLVMGLLEGHIPISLICDLAGTDTPTSAEILAAEGEPDTRWWEPDPAS